MKYINTSKTFIITVLLTIFSTAIAMAQPPAPGDGSDPFATPVNGGVAFVAVIAFLYGVYRMYQFAKKNGTENTRL